LPLVWLALAGGEEYVIEWEEALTLQDGEEKVAIVPIHHKARTANVLLTKHGRTKKSINKVVSKLIIRQRNNSSDHPIIIMGTYVCERSYFDNYKTNLILFPIYLKELISLDISAHPTNPVDASVPGQLYMGCCRNLFLTPITPILGMQHLCWLCEIHMS